MVASDIENVSRKMYQTPFEASSFNCRYRYLSVDGTENNNPATYCRVIYECDEYNTVNQQSYEEEASLEDECTKMLSSRVSHSCSVVILGELSVGKSALCRNFFRKNLLQPHQSKEKFLTNDDLTDELLEECQDESDKNHHIFEMPVLVNGVRSRMKILDVNTEKQFMESSCMDGFGDLHQYLDAGDGYIVSYAVTDKGTFETARTILKTIEKIESLGSSSPPIILVGNKCDLVRKRQVSTADGIKLAEKFRVKFIETSATLNQNVEQLFEGVITQIRLRGLERGLIDNRTTSKMKNDVTSHSSRDNMRQHHTNSNRNDPKRNDFIRYAEKKDKAKKEGLAGKCLKKLMKNKNTSKCLKNCQDFSIL